MVSILAQNGIFELNLSTLLSFLIGIGLGAVLVCLIYVLLIFGSLRNKKFLIKTDDDTLTTSDVKDLIIQAQKDFKNKSLRRDKSKVVHCKDISFALVYGIATKFYPKSKYPLFELSIDEVLMLLNYVSDRLEEILNRVVLRRVKGIKISTILDMSNKTNKVISSNAFKMSKEVSAAVSTFKKVINTINPVWWIRKGVIDTSIDLIVGKICLAVIAIVGEETYKIYSKKVFDKEVDIESNVDALMNQLDDELKEEFDKAKNDEEIEKIQEDYILDQIFDKYPMKTNSFILKEDNSYLSSLDMNMPMKGMCSDEKEKDSDISR